MRDDRGVERVVIVVVLVVAAVTVALVIQRRRESPAPTRTGGALPDRVDRHDFQRPEASWLVALFASQTCRTCDDVWRKVQALASDEVAVQRLDVETEPALHRRYVVSSVPGLIVADREGMARARFLGPVTAADLWATLAELRQVGGGGGG
jgi:thioredoxin-related protein